MIITFILLSFAFNKNTLHFSFTHLTETVKRALDQGKSGCGIFVELICNNLLTLSINGFNSKFERNVLVVHVTLVKPNVMQKLDEMNIIN